MDIDGTHRDSGPQTSSRGDAPRAVQSGSEWHRVTVEPGYVRAELYNRQSLEETQRFLDATVSAAREHRCANLLICIRNSKPLFAVERYGFSHYLDIALESNFRIALVGSTRELRIAHQYYSTLAQQRGVNLSAFQDESAAIAWLISGQASSPSPEQS